MNIDSLLSKANDREKQYGHNEELTPMTRLKQRANISMRDG